MRRCYVPLLDASFNEPMIGLDPEPINIPRVRMTCGVLALASRRHVSAREWPAITSSIIRAIVEATGQRWSMTVNCGGPPVNHRRTTGNHHRTTSQPPVNDG
ncbi:hypothetical protein Tco_0165936 [Tanacetum coccineum]